MTWAYICPLNGEWIWTIFATSDSQAIDRLLLLAVPEYDYL